MFLLKILARILEILIDDKAGKVIEEHFQSLLSRYQNALQMSMNGSDLIFDFVHLLYCKCHKINFKRGGLCIDSPDWLKRKNETINCINKNNNKCFQYALKVTLNHEKIEGNLEE